MIGVRSWLSGESANRSDRDERDPTNIGNLDGYRFVDGCFSGAWLGSFRRTRRASGSWCWAHRRSSPVCWTSATPQPTT